MELVGLRFGLRQLSYQHCFREGQPASSLLLSTLHDRLPALVLHYLVASSLCLPCLTSSWSPLLLTHLNSFLCLTLFLPPPLSPPVLHLLCLWGMTLLPGLSVLATQPHSFLTAPTLLELESETSTFTAVKTLQGQLYDFFLPFSFTLEDGCT